MCSILDSFYASCKNGQAISIGNFCNRCEECPIFTQSRIALKSNCTKKSNQFCPVSPDSSKICMDKHNVSISAYCSLNSDNDYWQCPHANSGITFEQCYDV